MRKPMRPTGAPAASCGSTRRRNLTIPLSALWGPAATLDVMHPALKALGGLDELDAMLAASGDRPLLLFKHSRSCGTSAEALDELVAHLDERPADATYAIVTVQTHRDVSNAVTSRLGVRHATPQALLVREGRVFWSASHFRVTAAAVAEAILSSQPTV